MGLNPITHDNGLPVQPRVNKAILIGFSTTAIAHYLGNRFIWRWYTDSQIFAMHIPINVAATGVTRLVSNLFPGQDQQVIDYVDNGDGTQTAVPRMQRTLSIPGFLVGLGMTFSPMVLLPMMGVPRVGFWGCFIGFSFHFLVTSIPVAIVGTATIISGVCIAVWTGAIRPPKATGHYETLGVDRSASSDDITGAYRKLARQYHPDKLARKSQEEQVEATEVFKGIANAYGVLCDPEKRAKYDKFGLDDQSSMKDWKTIVCVLVFVATDRIFGKKAEESASSTGGSEVF